MRNLFALLVFLLSVTAIAHPEVGDTANFVATLVCPHESGQGTPSTNPCYLNGTHSGMASIKILSENSPQEDSRRYRYSLSQTYSGNTFNWPESTIFTFDLPLSTDLVEYILKNCGRGGSRLKTINVPAGTFRTCMAKMGNGDVVYWGQVPTGIVRYDQRQSWGSFSLKLQSL